MVTEKITYNAIDVGLELDWLEVVLDTRASINTGQANTGADVYDIPLPVFTAGGGATGSSSDYADFVDGNSLDFDERLVLILTMAPHIRPEMLDRFLIKNTTIEQIYTEFGGTRGKSFTGFIPTGETAVFILTGGDLEIRFSLHRLFERDHLFATQDVLWIEDVDNKEPAMSGGLSISPEYLDLFSIGEISKPNFSADFPAELLTTQMAWDDLVLTPATKSRIDEIETWLTYRQTLMVDWGLGTKLKPGYKALFYGPPGTGKTLTATLLGNKLLKDVYRIDLSKVVSKYIGETEKNMSKIFDKAENKEWILFFDEADALFGKRTGVDDAQDRYANQEVSYLLQRIESHDGLVILATNMKNNIDDAFVRRFQSMINFPLPSPVERLILWQQGFSTVTTLEAKIDLVQIAEKYDMSGGSIINVVQYSSLRALEQGITEIQYRDLIEGIKKEYQKVARTI